MPVLVLLTASVLLGIVAVYPYTFYPLTLSLFRRQPSLPGFSRPPTATLVFCAYNEEASIPAKLANLEALRRMCPTMRFACFIDLSTDRTLDLLRSRSDLLSVQTTSARTGKASGMARLVAGIETDIVIFTDANVLLDPACVPALLEYFRDPKIGGVCGTLLYTNPEASDTTRTSTAYWRLEEKIKALESRSGSTMGADGSIFATRRSLYPFVPPDLLDDFIVSMSVIFRGLRLVSAPDVRAFETAAVDRTSELRRRRRIACRAYLSHRFLWPDVRRLAVKDIYKYVGHKLIRWYGIWFAAASASLAAVAVLLAFGGDGALAIVALGVTCAGLRTAHPLRIGWEVLRQFSATGMGMADAWRGRSYRTWEPPARSQAPSIASPTILS